MGVQFIKKPVDGSLPFLNANGFDIVEVMRTLRRFSTVANGGEVADNVRLSPVQIAAVENAALAVTEIVMEANKKDVFVPRQAASTINGMRLVPDTEVLPSEGYICKGNELLARIVNLAVPFTPVVQDKLDSAQQNKLVFARRLRDEAATLKSIAESLEKRAENLLS